MTLRRTAISVCALMAAMPAMAQDIELQAITVEDMSNEGFFGETIALDTGSVMKTGAPIAETPRSVSVVTEDKIARTGAQSVEEALQYTTGVAAGEYGLDNRSDWYMIRGFRPATFHDGLQARYGFYNDTKPEPFLLDRIEVLRGPASGLYGNGEVGGVVNTASKTSHTPSEDIVQLSFGSYERKQIAADFSGDLNESGTLRYRVVGLYRDAETQVDHSEDDAVAVAPSITWQPNPDTRLTLLGNYQKNDSSPLIQFASLYGTLEPSPDGRFLPDSLFVGEPGFDRYDSEQGAVSLILDQRLTDIWSVSMRARYLKGEADYRHAWWSYDNPPTRYNPDGTINRTFYRAENQLETYSYDINATADYSLGGWDMETLIGAMYSDGEYDSDTGYGAEPRPIDPFDPAYTGAPAIDVEDTPANIVRETGVYVQNRATLNDRLHVDFGLRWGEIETGEATRTFRTGAVNATDSEWTKNLAVLYEFDNGVAPYLSYAESFRQEQVGEDADGNPFRPTRGEQYEIGVKYQPPGTRSLFTLAAFDLTKSNLLEDDPDNPNFQIQTGEASSRGIEIGAETRLGDFTIDAGATFLETENEAGYSIATIADRTASVWVDYAPGSGALEGWSFGLGARHVGERWDGTDTQETPAQTRYDARIAYETDRYNVAFNVRNLADDRTIDFCGVSTCYFGKGRSMALTASAKF